MNPAFHTLDIIIFAAYIVIIVGLGIWISHRKKNKDKTAEDYFLAGKSLPWWTIGASLIAANISAEQFHNRMILRAAILRHGFVPVDSEWWHFTLKDEPYPETYFVFPVKEL